MTNLYATDGKCHNANYGSYGHECGKPAVWLGTDRNGFTSGFCERCKTEGDEARNKVAWVALSQPTPVARMWWIQVTDNAGEYRGWEFFSRYSRLTDLEREGLAGQTVRKVHRIDEVSGAFWKGAETATLIAAWDARNT